VSDATLLHEFREENSQDLDSFSEGLKAGHWTQAPARLQGKADRVILESLRADSAAVVVSNETFKKVTESRYRPVDLEERHLKFHCSSDRVLVLFPDSWQMPASMAKFDGAQTGRPSIALVGLSSGGPVAQVDASARPLSGLAAPVVIRVDRSFPPALLAFLIAAGAGIPSFVVLAMSWGITEAALRIPGDFGTALGIALSLVVIPLVLLFVALLGTAYAQHVMSENPRTVSRPSFILTGITLWTVGLILGFWYLGTDQHSLSWLAIPGAVFALGGGLPILSYVSLREAPSPFGGLGAAVISVLTIALSIAWIVSVLAVLVATVIGWDGANQYAFLFVVSIFLLPVIQAVLVLIGLIHRPVESIRDASRV
jgi:hypothetical protein